MPKTNWIYLDDSMKCEGPLGYGFVFNNTENPNFERQKRLWQMRPFNHDYTVYNKEDKLIRKGSAKTLHGAKVLVGQLVCGFDANFSRAERERYSQTTKTNKIPSLSLTAIDSHLILEALQNLTIAIQQQTQINSSLLARITIKSASTQQSSQEANQNDHSLHQKEQ